jgi:hypothetical protein
MQSTELDILRPLVSRCRSRSPVTVRCAMLVMLQLLGMHGCAKGDAGTCKGQFEHHSWLQSGAGGTAHAGLACGW